MVSEQIVPIVLLAGAVFVVAQTVPAQPVRSLGVGVFERLPAMARFGASLRRWVGVAPGTAEQNQLWGASAAMFGSAVIHPGVPIIGLGVIWGRHIARVRRRRITKQQQGWESAPEAAHVMALAVRSGANVYQAIHVVALRVPNVGGETFSEISRRLTMGVLLDQALDELTLRLGDAGEPLARVVRRCVATGAELAPALDRVAIELRSQLHQRQLESARRLPVLLLFPLVTCTLPAFALLTVVPLLVSSLAQLSG